MPLKIVHVLNMANNGYHIVKALRRNGFEADLIISSADFGMALPQWEEYEVNEDPYSIPFDELIKKYRLPPYVKVWRQHKPRTKSSTQAQSPPGWLRILKDYVNTYPFTVPDLYKMVKDYDVLHLHNPTPIFFPLLNKPKVIHEAGWIRTLVTRNDVAEKLGRRAYEKADSVVWTNPDTGPLLATLNIKRLDFVPFIIDPEQYRPVETEKSEDLLFFHPARHVWDVKGNDRLIKAFSKFINAGYRATLRMIDWGYEEDVKLSKQIVAHEKIEAHVEWCNPYSKPELIKCYSEADAVFDQFLLGSGGTTCFEAMSCEVPLVIHLNHWNEKCFGEMPPIINASSIDELYESMIDLTDAKYRRGVGRAERQFTMEHNHPDIIAKQLMNIYEEVSQ